MTYFLIYGLAVLIINKDFVDETNKKKKKKEEMLVTLSFYFVSVGNNSHLILVDILCFNGFYSYLDLAL